MWPSANRPLKVIMEATSNQSLDYCKRRVGVSYAPFFNSRQWRKLHFILIHRNKFLVYQMDHKFEEEMLARRLVLCFIFLFLCYTSARTGDKEACEIG